jgi:hypothetical protein
VEPGIEYQLVLQFPASSLGDYDALASLEAQVEEALGESGDVDGHDIGAGEANIFIITFDPEAAFDRVLRLLLRSGRSAGAKAAFRAIEGDRYHVLWPKNSTGEFTVA